MLRRTYPSKVLLFGEHTILSGSKALAVPFDRYQGQWSMEETDRPERAQSRTGLEAFLKHDSTASIHAKRLRQDFENGLWFDSTIPQGYGIGSSGALIAAVFESYGIKRTGAIQAKQTLARLEDCFHGSSSGIDPLVSYIQRPLLIHNFEDISVLDQDPKLQNFFLLDTGRPRQAGALISIYKEKLKDPQFSRGCSEVLSKEVNLGIDAFLGGNTDLLAHHLWHISKFQWDFFPEMIPTAFRGVWAKGLESGDYVLKLCGAGGGGYLLGYSKHELSRVQENLGDLHLIALS